MGTRGRCITGVVVVALALIGAPRAYAFGPSNDNLANAADLGTTQFPADTGQYLGGSAEAGEPDHAGHTANNSVWEKWTAPMSMQLELSTCKVTNAFDSVLEVYSGPASNPDFTNITSIAHNDDGCGGTSKLSRLKFGALAGQTYYIVVDAVGTPGGSYEIDGGPPPSNDDFQGALLTGSPVTAHADNTYATDETNEPAHVTGIPGAVSVWWTWTAPSTSNFTIQTCNSSITDTMLAVYTGSAFTTGITQVASNDDGCGDLSVLTLAATAGTDYHIAVDGKNVGFSGYGSGPITLDISAPPANDDLTNATVEPGFPVSATGSTIGATRETSENSHAGLTATNSIWYRWTAPDGEPVTIDTCGSSVDTVLSVYNDGNSFPLGTAVAENDNSATCSPQSSVYFTPTAASTYAIAIDGQTGVVQFQIHDDTPPVVHITSAVIKQSRRRATFTFSGTDDRGGTVIFQCKMDAANFGPCPVPTVYRRLRPGSHTFKVEGIDAYGNTAIASKTFRIKRR